MGDSRNSVYKQYLMKRYWEHKNEYELPKLIPYEDSHIDLESNPYDNPREPKTHVNEVALDSLINKILTNQAISLADGKDHYEDFETNPLGYDSGKVPKMYKIQSNSFSDGRLPKKRSGSKPSRRSRSRKPSEDDERYTDLPEGSEVSYTDGVPMVTLSIDMLRRYMYIEVEARVRYINQYYVRQWDEINKEKLSSYAELILLKEKNETLICELEKTERNLLNYKKMCAHLENKFEVTKEAKRRRRQAKKQRKSDTPAASQSDTVSCAHAQNAQEEAGDKPEVSENEDEMVKEDDNDIESLEENNKACGEHIDYIYRYHGHSLDDGNSVSGFSDYNNKSNIDEHYSNIIVEGNVAEGIDA